MATKPNDKGADAQAAETAAAAETQAAEGQTTGEEASPGVEESLEELKAKLAAETAARGAAEERERQARADAEKARQVAQNEGKTRLGAQLDAVSRALETSEATLVNLESEYETAMAASNFKEAAKIQRQMSEEGARKVALETGKANLQAAVQQEAERPREDRRAPTFEEAVSRYTPRTQAWLRLHPDYLTDETKMHLAHAAHHTAVAQGLRVDSDDYFQSLEESLGLRAGPGAAPAPKKPSPGAPPSRNAGTSGVTKDIKVSEMTPRMRQLAKESEMTDEKWLTEYNRLRREDPSYQIN